MQKLLLIIAVCFSAVALQAQENDAPQSAIKYSSKESILAAMQSAPCDAKDRLEGVKKLFLDAGASEQEINIETYDKSKVNNLVVRKKGDTEETIVIGAHYDHVGGGCGAIDNWSGIVIIANIYKTLRSLQTKKSYMFAAFDKEEAGLVGSGKMLKNMPQQESEKICSMVNFDSFGQGYPMALKNTSSEKLIKLAEKVGKEGGLKFISVDIPQASSDSKSFLDKKIPAITLNGLTNDWTEILHSGKDKIGNVKIDSVVVGYRFGIMYLAHIDNAGCREFK